MPAPMPTKPADERIQLRVPGEDKPLFEEAAATMRISVSAWLRLAGFEKLEREQQSPRKGGGG
jgi:hypothetical protein